MSEKTVSNRSVLWVIASVTVAGFVVWVGGLFLVWLVLAALKVETGFWPMLEALSTAVTAAAVLGGGIVAYRELDELSNVRHLDVADRLFQELNSPENVEARRWVYLNLPDDPEQGLVMLKPNGRESVKRVLNSLDRVAFLTQARWIPEETILPWMSLMVVKSWEKLGPYVEYERARRGEPDYYQAVSGLARRCQEWRAAQFSGSEVNWVEHAL